MAVRGLSIQGVGRITLPLLCLLLATTALLFTPPAGATAAWSPGDGPYMVDDKSYFPLPAEVGHIQNGRASWYGPPFHGRRTSNGEIYDMHAMTAAHRTLPMDTVLLVENLENGKKTLVRVNDRGPLLRGRIIDLSYKAAKALGLVGNGTARVGIAALAEGTIEQDGEPPTLVQKDFSVGEFYVQIGSFAKKFNALKLQKRFMDAGHTTVIHESLDPREMFYRVRVYVGKTLQSARNAEKDLLRSGYKGAFIVAQ